MTDSDRLDRIVVLLTALCKKLDARVPRTTPAPPMTDAEKQLIRRAATRGPDQTDLTTPEEFWARKDTGGV